MKRVSFCSGVEHPPIPSMQQTSLTSQRIITVDALRGFALLGILYAHFIFWYSGAGLPQSVYSNASDPASIVFEAITGIFIQGKFYTFFSFLFGLSFFLQMKSLQKKGTNFFLRYSWRLIILGIIGLIHHALWRGDILSIYVPLGFLLLLMRNFSDRTVLIIAILLVMNIPLRLIDIVHLIVEPAVAATTNTPTAPVVDETAQRYYEIMKNGSFWAMIRDNWAGLATKFDFQFQSGRIYITLGFFMLGMYSGRKRWFEEPLISKPLIKRICKWSGWLTLGITIIPIALFAANNVFKLGWEENKYMLLLFNLLVDASSTTMTIFYLSGLTMLMYRVRWQKILHPLAAVGKMALSAYLSQTLFGLLLFYHFGLGLFVQTAPWLNMLIGTAVFVVQAVFCRWWLQYFNYGPVEWVWRSLTFFSWFPLKKQQLKSV